MSLLLLGLAVGLLAFLALSGRSDERRLTGRRASFLALAIAYGAPALFLAVVLHMARDDATRFRFALLGLGFRGEADRELSVPIGGDRDRDGIWISALADERAGRPTSLGRFVFEPPVAGDRGTISYQPPSGAGAGLLGVRPQDGPLRPWSALELQDGDRFDLSGRQWEVEFDTGFLGPPAAFVDGEGQRVDLPARVGQLPFRVGLPILRPLPPVLETYALAWLEEAVSGEDGPRDAGFLYWQGRGSLWLAAPQDFQVERGGEVLAPERPAFFGVRSVHVLSQPRWSGSGFAGGGIRDRRSFRLLPGRRSFALAYDSPEIHVLSPATLAELAVIDAEEDDADVVRFNLSMGGWQVTDESLYFRHASRRVALESLATLEMPRAFLDGRWKGDHARYITVTPRGQRPGRLGEPVWLGGEQLAAVQVDILRPPRVLAFFALGLAVLKVLAGRAARLSLAHLLLAAALEALVTLRLLLGYRVWAMPPFEQEALDLALVAWGLLPWAFLVASAPAFDRFAERSRFLDVLPALGGWFFALAWCWTFAGGGVHFWVWLLCLVFALGAWLLRSPGLLERLERLAEGALQRFSDRWGTETGGKHTVLGLWVGVAFLPAFGRLALLFLGNRESLLVGSQRFALSLIHIPLALLLEAAYLVWLWRRSQDEREMRLLDLVPALAIAVGTWLLPALFANDLGLALLNLPVFLFAVAAVTLAAGRRLTEGGPLGHRWWIHALPAVVLALYLAFAAFPIGARLLIAALPDETAFSLESERNYLRLLAFAYPERLEEVARRSSEELTVMSSVMRAYTSGPFLGRGYFHSELSPHIQATALREHVPVVFVAAEWGLAGILGLVIFFFAAAAAGRTLAVWNTEDGGPRTSPLTGFWSSAAFLAAWTLAIPSLYMILANYRLTLFTGKNTYLLGLDSTADVLEVLFLALLFAFGASIVRDEEAQV